MTTLETTAVPTILLTPQWAPESVDEILGIPRDSQKADMIYAIAERGEVEVLNYMPTIVGVLDMDVNAEVKVAVCAALRVGGRAAGDYTTRLPQLLADTDDLVVSEACYTAAAVGSSAKCLASTINSLAKDGSESVKMAAVVALGSIGAVEYTSTITRALSDTSSEVQKAACLAVGMVGISEEDGKNAATEIASISSNPRCKIEAATALGMLGDLACEQSEALCKQLDDGDEDVRLAVAVSIGQLASSVAANDVAFNYLKGLLKSDDGRFRCAAAVALANMKEHASAAAEDLKDFLYDDFIEPLNTSVVAGGCRARCPSALRRTKCAGALALGAMGSKGAEFADEIAYLLEDPDWEVRVAACDAIAALGEDAKDQATKIIPLLEDEKYFVRARAAHALGQIKDPDTAANLADIVSDACPSVKEEALAALAKLGDEGAEHIEKVFERLLDFSITVRAAAIRTLGNMGEKGQYYAGAVVQRLLEDPPLVKLAALEALGQMEDHGVAYVEEIADFLNSPVPELRAAAATALGKFGSEAEGFSSGLKALRNDPAGELVSKPALEACIALGVCEG